MSLRTGGRDITECIPVGASRDDLGSTALIAYGRVGGGAVQKRPASFYPVIMRFVARARMGEHDTPELCRNAEALDRNAWPWPLFGLFLGEVTANQLRASTVRAIGEEATRRKYEVAFLLAEYYLLHRRRDEAATLAHEAASSCSFDFFERNAAIGEAKGLRP
jgi:lipoprotein NlpI